MDRSVAGRCAYTPCKKRFIGGIKKKFCSASCRVRNCKAHKKKLLIEGLRELLELELSFVKKSEFDKVVGTCVYSVKKWLRDNN